MNRVSLQTAVPIYQGLEAVSVTGWPGVQWDIGVLNDWLHRLLPAGFYYKTFMWPNNWWNVYGYFIRRMAGLGKAPETYRPEDRYEKRYHHCDVLVVGAGPARACSRTGRRNEWRPRHAGR